MAEDVITPGGFPVLVCRDIDIYTASPEDLFTPGGNPIQPVRFVHRLVNPELVRTPGGTPILFLRDVDQTPTPELTFTPGRNPVMAARLIANLASPEVVFTPAGQLVQAVQLVDDAGNFVSGGATFDFTGGTMPAGAALTRASTGWAFNASTVLTSYANDVPRFSYDPLTAVLQGLLVEAAETNGIRNSSAAGAAAGSPGTIPTNWASLAAAPSALARQIVGTGTEDGIPYIDYRYSGTPNATSNLGPQFEGNQVIAALNGETWTASYFVKLAAGSLANLSTPCRLTVSPRVAAGTAASGGGPVTDYTPTSAALRTQRRSAVRTMSDPLTAFIQCNLGHFYSNGLAVDFTLRVGSPQLGKSGALGSPIPTLGAAAVTRAADVLTLTLPSGTYNVAVNRLSGTTSLPGTVVSGGAWTVPADPSPVRSVVFG